VPSGRLRGPCSPRRTRQNQAASRLTSPRIIRHARRGVNEPTCGRSILAPLPRGGRSGIVSSRGPAPDESDLLRVYRTPPGALRPRGLVAGRVALRGLRGGDPRPEHRVGERRADPGVAPASRPPLVRGARPPARLAARPAPALLGDLPGQGAPAARPPRLPRLGVRRARRGMGRAPPGPAPQAPRRCRASGRRPPTRSPSTPRGTPSSSWTPTPAASSPASDCCAATRATRGPALLRGAPPPRRRLYNDYHAQLVRLAKDVCRPRPRCAECPLERPLPRGGWS
jgi:hypothetical protein